MINLIILGISVCCGGALVLIWWSLRAELRRAQQTRTGIQATTVEALQRAMSDLRVALGRTAEEQRLAFLRGLIPAAVAYAEQASKKHTEAYHAKLPGESKLRMAVAYVEQQCKSFGVPMVASEQAALVREIEAYLPLR